MFDASEDHAVVHGRRPIRSREDIDAIYTDARTGDAGAVRLLALINAAGAVGPADWPSALRWMAAAAEIGDDEARGELILLSSDDDLRADLTRIALDEAEFPRGIWLSLAQSIDLDALLGLPATRLTCQAPLMAVSDEVASPALCQWLIARAEPHLERARVIVPDSSEALVHDDRTNSMVEFRFSSTGLPLLALRHRLAQALRMPVEHFEASNVLHYAPGQTYAAHFDSFAPDTLVRHERHAAFGQRVNTVLVYLNDDYAQGETHFPELKFRFKGRAGQALYWRNTLPRSREVDPMTLHEGLPPADGVKWVLSHWVREQPVPIYR